MMKLFARLMLTVLVLAAVLPFVTFGANGGPLLRWDDLKLPDFSFPELDVLDLESLKASIGLADKEPAPTFPAKPMYRWTDGRGNVQYSGFKPPPGIDYVVINPGTNTNGSVSSITMRTVELPDDDKAESGFKVPQNVSPFSAYNPETVNNLMQDAQNVQNMMDQRFEQQQEMLQNLQNR